jgi:dATP pyrophosphohydrolase
VTDAARKPKIPESVLVVIHTAAGQVLLLERADHPGYWQSVTGSKDTPDELLLETCRREVLEETGLDVLLYKLLDWRHTNRFEIFKHWRGRYADGVTHNTEHVFGLCLPEALPVRLSPREHLQYAWLAWQEAAGRCFSWTNAQAIQSLAQRLALR